MTTYDKLREIVRLANKPGVALNGSVDIDVDFLSSVNVMVEELKESLEYVKRLRPRGLSMQSGVDSYLTTTAINQANFISEKYWPEEK